jgi:hypothetical protein
MKKKTVKKKKDQPVKRAYTKRPAFDAKGETFEIEPEPPEYKRGQTPEKFAFYEKLARTVLQVKPGQAFVIPRKGSEAAKSWLKRTYPGLILRFTQVVGNKDMVRVYNIPNPIK